MSASNITTAKTNSNELSRDIEYLLSSTDDDSLKKSLVAEIAKEIRYLVLRKWFIVLLLIAFVSSQIYLIPFLNWNASAIGRIVMIKVLKIWDWRYLYNAECLIERKVDAFERIVDVDVDNDCSYCETIEEIRHDWDISYSDLKSNYINRGHPVVIEDHQFISQHSNLNDYIESIKNITDLIESNPCNLQTNLVTGSHYTNLNELFELTKTSWDGWFLHFRNCDFSAMKASRALDRQPAFLTTHPKPFSSSWILISSKYKASKPKKLLVKHMVVVKQIVGGMNVFIAPKSECREICMDFQLQLDVGSTIVFSAELWDFLYVPSGHEDAVSFLREYEFRI